MQNNLSLKIIDRYSNWSLELSLTLLSTQIAFHFSCSNIHADEIWNRTLCFAVFFFSQKRIKKEERSRLSCLNIHADALRWCFNRKLAFPREFARLSTARCKHTSCSGVYSSLQIFFPRKTTFLAFSDTWSRICARFLFFHPRIVSQSWFHIGIALAISKRRLFFHFPIFFSLRFF